MAHQIVVLIQEQPDITIVEIAQRLGRTARGVEKQIRQLREAEVIGRVGPTKGGHWEVLNRVESGGKNGGESGGEMAVKVLRRLAANPHSTVRELARALGAPQRSIERLLQQLRQQKLLRRIGAAKGGHWEVLK